MFRPLQIAFLSFTMIGLIASFSVLAQAEPEPRFSDPYADVSTTQPVTSEELALASANAALAEQAAQARQNAAQAAQTNENTADIAQIQRMTGTQDFILKLVAIIMPLLIAMMTGIMLYIQIKQKAAGEARGVQQREDLILVARSVNGIKTELVAKAELAAFLEGVQTEANGVMSMSAKIRLAELQEAARLATEKAEAAANKTIAELRAKQTKSKPEVVSLVPGETKIMEGVDYGTAPANNDVVAVHPNEVKKVVGVSP